MQIFNICLKDLLLKLFIIEQKLVSRPSLNSNICLSLECGINLQIGSVNLIDFALILSLANQHLLVN
jgi:hypothetical protein